MIYDYQILNKKLRNVTGIIIFKNVILVDFISCCHSFLVFILCEAVCQCYSSYAFFFIGPYKCLYWLIMSWSPFNCGQRVSCACAWIRITHLSMAYNIYSNIWDLISMLMHGSVVVNKDIAVKHYTYCFIIIFITCYWSLSYLFCLNDIHKMAWQMKYGIVEWMTALSQEISETLNKMPLLELQLLKYLLIYIQWNEIMKWYQI